MFKLLDFDGSGRVDFSEYLTSVVMVDSSSTRQEMMELAFQMYGGEKRRISREQSASLLRLTMHLSPSDAQNISNTIPTDTDGLLSLGQLTLEFYYVNSINSRWVIINCPKCVLIVRLYSTFSFLAAFSIYLT